MFLYFLWIKTAIFTHILKAPKKSKRILVLNKTNCIFANRLKQPVKQFTGVAQLLKHLKT